MSGTRSVRDLLQELGRIAPWGKAAGWDPVGLQLGDPEAGVRELALCHEVTERVVELLEREPVGLLVSYHPLLFHPTQTLVAGATPGGRSYRLIRAGVAVASVHTNFDVAPGGAADALADALGVVDAKGFAPLYGADSVKVVTFLPEVDADRVLGAVVESGAGTIGNYTHCSFRASGTGTFYAGEGTAPVVGKQGAVNREPEIRLEFVAARSRLDAVLTALVAAHPYEEPAYDVYDRRGDAGMVGRIGPLREATRLDEFSGRVREALGSGAVRVGGDPSRRIERVAAVPGAGAEFTALARELGADVMVTGDVSHHRAREALDRGLALVDPGHAATERPGLLRLEKRVTELGVPTRLLDLDPDPWSATSDSPTTG